MVADFQRSLPVSSERVDSFCSKAVHEMPLQKFVQNERIVRPIREVNLLLKQVRDRESPGKCLHRGKNPTSVQLQNVTVGNVLSAVAFRCD